MPTAMPTDVHSQQYQVLTNAHCGCPLQKQWTFGHALTHPPLGNCFQLAFRIVQLISLGASFWPYKHKLWPKNRDHFYAICADQTSMLNLNQWNKNRLKNPSS